MANQWDAVITALNGLVDAVHQVVTTVQGLAAAPTGPVPPLAVPVLSPNGTVLLAQSLGVITDALGNTWGITPDGRVEINGVADPATLGVVQLAYVGGLVWQQNVSGDWYSETGPSAGWSPKTKVSPLPSTPPPGAAEAGYTNRTFGPDIILGQNWLKDTQNGTTANATTNADGSVTVAGGGDTWNEQLKAVPTFGGGFYAHATVAVPGPTGGLSTWTGGKSGSEWPSWWMKTVNNSVEFDTMEMMEAPEGTYGITIHNWETGTSRGEGQTITAPGGNTLHGPNVYGVRWIPATATGDGSMSFYLNDLPVGKPWTWTKANPGLYGIIDGQQVMLRMGAGANSPATFSRVEVWQGPNR